MSWLSLFGAGKALLSWSQSFLERFRAKSAMSGERNPDEDEGKSAAAPATSLPDFYTDPNAVIGDEAAVWRFGKRPDYAKTRLFYAECEMSSVI